MSQKTQYSGYYPGVAGKIIEMHAVYYHEQWGFDISFETQVGRELCEFLVEFDKSRDGLWVARRSGMFAGAVAIDGRNAQSEGARLRWFIVAPVFQGHGIGKELISQAVAFCRQNNFPRIFLWTFEGLDSARHLYEIHDFKLSEQHDIDQWGQHLNEQKFELVLTDKSS